MTTFSALSEPHRRQLLDVLIQGPQSVGTLVDSLDMSQPVVSKHLRILRDAGLVSVEPAGQRRLYSINPAPFAELDSWLEPYRKLWSGRLDALELHLKDTHKKAKK